MFASQTKHLTQRKQVNSTALSECAVCFLAFNLRSESCDTRSLLETSLPGVFAVGDVRCGNVKRVASAVGEGSIAVSFVHRTLAE